MKHLVRVSATLALLAGLLVGASFAQPAQAVTPRSELIAWYAYGPGSSEEAALLEMVGDYEQRHPFANITLINVPFGEIFSRYEAEVMAGGGPDMFTAPNDALGNEVRAGLIMPLDDLLKKNDLKKYSLMALDGVTVEGKVYAVPGLVKAVALYYNRRTVPTPPATTEALLQMVRAGKRLAINPDVYHNFGFWGAFGGALMDQSGKCIADQGGFAEAYQYLKDLRDAGAIFDWGQEWAMANGDLDMTITGPWVLKDIQMSLGQDLGIALMPAGPAGPARPITGIDGWFINPNSPNKEAALDLALDVFGKQGLETYATIAGDPPGRVDVKIRDPLVAVFAEAAQQGVPRPQSPEMNNYWLPFSWALYTVLYEGTSPEAAVAAACQWMNDANGK